MAPRAARQALAQRGEDAPTWEAAACALCDEADARPLLAVPHPDAPGGASAIVECTWCRLRRLSPRPGPAVIGGYYQGNHGAFAGRRRGPTKQAVWEWLRDVAAASPGRGVRWHTLRPLVRPLAEWMFDVNVPLEGRSGLRVLEVGCGYGDLLLYLQSRGCDVTGVDLDARAAAKGRELGVPVREGSLAAQHLPAASFDVVVLCHSLEHIADPRAELREIARLLRPGGRLHVAVPNGSSAGLGAEGLEWEHLSPPLHFWFFDRETLATLLRETGFDPVRPAYATSCYRRLVRHAGECRTLGPRAAIRRWWRYARARLTARDGGDVLRVVATRA